MGKYTPFAHTSHQLTVSQTKCTKANNGCIKDHLPSRHNIHHSRQQSSRTERYFEGDLQTQEQSVRTGTADRDRRLQEVHGFGPSMAEPPHVGGSGLPRVDSWGWEW